MYKKKLRLIILFLVSAILIHIYSANAARVENQYSKNIYPFIATFLRFLTGWLPFSIGDVLYGVAALWLTWKLFYFLFRLIKRKVSWVDLKNGFLNTLIVLLCIYIVFNLFWGINYNRLGIAYQLGLPEKKYTASELRNLDSLLLLKANESKSALLRDSIAKKNHKEIFNESVDAYKNLSNVYPFLSYKQQSVKSSIWGWLGNYLGFAGYYNPFTGEAQVNTTEPYFLNPYTTCHEMAHQLGYAKENEANFVGYLAAAASNDTLFHYSVYLDLFLTADRNLFIVDSVTAKKFSKQLLPQIKSDLKDWRTFNMQHKSPIEPVIQWLYNKYLQNNKQPSGILTYDEVTGLLIEYNKKFGKL